MMSLIKIGMDDSQSFADLVNYINTEKALQIISGILLSVVIAFTAGTIIQWVSKLFLLFNTKKKIKNFGFLFASFMFDRYRIFHLF